MSYFGDFLEEELAVILSIPYRAGLLVAHADDVPGVSRDEEREQMALENALKAIDKRARDDSFIDEVIEYTLEHREHWTFWDQNYDSVLDDIPMAMKMVRDRLPEDALKGYQKGIYYVANVVAQAFREEGAMRDPKNLKKPSLLGGLIERMSSKADLDSPENVSAKEREVLQKLLQCLKG